MLSYWNETGDDRHSFLRTLVAFLDNNRWESMTDSGWDEFDVTIYGDRFSQVLVKTVSEHHGGNKVLLRARLTPKWTLSTRIMICLFAIMVCFSFALTARPQVTTLLSVLLALMSGVYLHSRKCRTLRLVAGMFDLTARQRNWTKLATTRASTEAPATRPPEPADAPPADAAPPSDRPGRE
jgi:hypothetical protein